MKIVQTFWSGGQEVPLLHTYGWKRPEYHLFSWALSVYRLRQHYDEVELYTDKKGKELLIDQLKLPYTKVHLGLDDINRFHPNAWALSKIHTYARQTTPFLHVDGDIFIWEPFDEEQLKQPYLVQSVENGEMVYSSRFKAFCRDLKDTHPLFPDPESLNKDLFLYNTGLFGGTGIDLIQAYCAEAFELAEKNKEVLHQLNATSFSLFVEQYLFYLMLEKEGKEVTSLIPGLFFENSYVNFGDFEEVPFKRTYLHLLAQFKSNDRVLKLLECQLRQEFPEAYLTILGCLESVQYEVESATTSANFENTLSLALWNAWDTEAENDQQLLARDLTCHGLFRFIFDRSPDDILNCVITQHPGLRIVIPEPVLSSEGQSAEIPVDGPIALVTELGGGQSEVVLDELDLEILQQIKEPTTIFALLKHLAPYFDEQPPYSEDFIGLIHNRLNGFIQHRLITCPNYQPKPQSNPNGKRSI